MITRAQAEALLSLAEALEACEREGYFIGSYLRQGSGTWMITPDVNDVEDTVTGMEVRLFVSARVPKSAPDPLPAQIAELRRRSGEGVLSCRKALDAHPNDLDGAIEHLRCEGQLVVRQPGALQPCGCPVRGKSIGS